MGHIQACITFHGMTHLMFLQEMEPWANQFAVTYPSHFGDQHTDLGTQALAPKKHLSSYTSTKIC